MQPGSEGGATVKTADLAPCLQKCLLSDILGVDRVSRHTAGQLEHRAAMTLYKRTERVTIAATRIFNGGIIALIHQAVSLDSDACRRLVGRKRYSEGIADHGRAGRHGRESGEGN
jgi:hypothetical protein